MYIAIQTYFFSCKINFFWPKSNVEMDFDIPMISIVNNFKAHNGGFEKCSFWKEKGSCISYKYNERNIGTNHSL